GDVIAGDDVLRRNLQRLLAQIDPYHPVHRSKDQDDSRALGVGEQASEAEYYAPLVFAQDLDGTEKIQTKDDADHNQENSGNFHNASVMTVASDSRRKGRNFKFLRPLAFAGFYAAVSCSPDPQLSPAPRIT